MVLQWFGQCVLIIQVPQPLKSPNISNRPALRAVILWRDRTAKGPHRMQLVREGVEAALFGAEAVRRLV